MQERLADRAILTFALLATAALTGCATSGPTVTPRGTLPDRFPEHSASEIRQFVQSGTDTVHAYRANASMSIQSPERSGSFSVEMQHRRRDSLRLSLSPGLGIEAARALVTPDSFFVYDRIKSRLIYGSRDQAPPSLPDVLTSRDLFATLTGFAAPPAGWRVSTDSTYYHLHGPQERRTYVVDPARWRVVRYVERDDRDRLVEEHVFSRFELVGNLLLPTKLLFRRPGDQRSAVLSYRKRSFNPKKLRLQMDVPSSVTRRRVQ